MTSIPTEQSLPPGIPDHLANIRAEVRDNTTGPYGAMIELQNRWIATVKAILELADIPQDRQKS
jgi:hypothetical protein